MNLEGQYFEWLYSLVGALSNPNPKRGYILLAEQLHQKEFVWSVPNDDNRAADGVELRLEFLDHHPIGDQDWFGRSRDVDSWVQEPCTMLELLIALSRRLAFVTYTNGSDNQAGMWFYRLLANIGLINFTDDIYNQNEGVMHIVNDALETVINRTYSPHGNGGLFPLEHSKEDLREVELWSQMSKYVLEFNDNR